MNPIAQISAEMGTAPSILGRYSSCLFSNILLGLVHNSDYDVDTFTVTVWWGTKKQFNYTDTCRFGSESLVRHCPIWIDAILYGTRNSIGILVKDDKGTTHGFVFSN